MSGAVIVVESRPQDKRTWMSKYCKSLAELSGLGVTTEISMSNVPVKEPVVTSSLPVDGSITNCEGRGEAATAEVILKV